MGGSAVRTKTARSIRPRAACACWLLCATTAPEQSIAEGGLASFGLPHEQDTDLAERQTRGEVTHRRGPIGVAQREKISQGLVERVGGHAGFLPVG